LYKSIHRKLKHIPKYTVSGPNEGNKTNVFKLYCYLQMNGSLKVQIFYNLAEIYCIHIPCSAALNIDLKGVTPIVFNHFDIYLMNVKLDMITVCCPKDLSFDKFK